MVPVTVPDMSTRIDCDTCEVRGLHCHDCVVTVLLGPPPELTFDDDEQRALDVLAESGLVPPLRLVRPGRPAPHGVGLTGADPWGRCDGCDVCDEIRPIRTGRAQTHCKIPARHRLKVWSVRRSPTNLGRSGGRGVDHTDPRGHRAESGSSTCRGAGAGEPSVAGQPAARGESREGGGTVSRPDRGRANVVPESVSSPGRRTTYKENSCSCRRAGSDSSPCSRVAP